jgi:hypothetical protein
MFFLMVFKVNQQILFYFTRVYSKPFNNKKYQIGICRERENLTDLFCQRRKSRNEELEIIVFQKDYLVETNFRKKERL